MTNIVIIGAQWGDEGKGKIVDWMSGNFANSHAVRVRLTIKTKAA